MAFDFFYVNPQTLDTMFDDTAAEVVIYLCSVFSNSSTTPIIGGKKPEPRKSEGLKMPTTKEVNDFLQDCVLIREQRAKFVED
eukprot:Pgem_evm1s4502